MRLEMRFGFSLTIPKKTDQLCRSGEREGVSYKKRRPINTQMFIGPYVIVRLETLR